MGPTNFHYASQLLERAGRNLTMIGCIQPGNIQVSISYNVMSKDHIKAYENLLRSGMIGCWNLPRSLGQANTSPLSNAAVPPNSFVIASMLRISSAFGSISHHRFNKENLPDDISSYSGAELWRQKQLNALHYIIVLEGRDGAAKQRLVIAYDRGDAAALMWQEAVNKYSVVFSAAIRASDSRKWFTDGNSAGSDTAAPEIGEASISYSRKDVEFVHVSSFEELLEEEKDADDWVEAEVEPMKDAGDKSIPVKKASKMKRPLVKLYC